MRDLQLAPVPGATALRECSPAAAACDSRGEPPIFRAPPGAGQAGQCTRGSTRPGKCRALQLGWPGRRKRRERGRGPPTWPGRRSTGERPPQVPTLKPRYSPTSTMLNRVQSGTFSASQTRMRRTSARPAKVAHVKSLHLASLRQRPTAPSAMAKGRRRRVMPPLASRAAPTSSAQARTTTSSVRARAVAMQRSGASITSAKSNPERGASFELSPIARKTGTRLHRPLGRPTPARHQAAQHEPLGGTRCRTPSRASGRHQACAAALVQLHA